jgi:RsiW-degrading membrane proteinase PrsW (M82 family)
MNSNSILLSQLKPFPAMAAIAFVLTALHVILSFVVFSRALLLATNWVNKALVLFFLISLAMHFSWLVYLWSPNNPFIRIGLGLEILCSLIFLLNRVWSLKKMLNGVSQKSEEE